MATCLPSFIFAQNTVTFGGSGSPLGDVYVAFDYTSGLLHGFVDVWSGSTGGRVILGDFSGDGVLDGDGFSDGLDYDGQFGPGFIDSTSPSIGGERIPDYDDLVELPTSFNTLTAQTLNRSQNLELVGTHRFGGKDESKSESDQSRNSPAFQNARVESGAYQYYNQSNGGFLPQIIWTDPLIVDAGSITNHDVTKQPDRTWDAIYGMRLLRLENRHVVYASGGVLGQSSWDTTVQNTIVGPELGLQYMRRRGRFSITSLTTLTLGVNVSSRKQHGGIGQDLIAGRYNHPLYLRPTSFAHQLDSGDFTPVIEYRLASRYEFTRYWSCEVGWTAIAIGDLETDAASLVKYSLPNLGFVDGDRSQGIFDSGVFCHLVWQR